MQIGEWNAKELGNRNWVGEASSYERGPDWRVEGVLVGINHSWVGGKAVTRLTFEVGSGSDKNHVQIELPSTHENPQQLFR